VPVTTCDLALGRLDDLGGFLGCLVPDAGVGVGKVSFGGVEPGGDRGPLTPSNRIDRAGDSYLHH
jgi:hypothetical protein